VLASVRHSSAPQHESDEVQAVVPCASHVAGNEHVPLEHVMPVQQSLSLVHDAPLARHRHAIAPPEDSQSMSPQQSLLDAHAPATPRQHVLVLGDGSQRSPLQQSLAVVQPVVPRAPHVGGTWHVPERHIVPPQQSLSSTQLWPLD
jgi:hypothetical protein